jgi:hypothetical protein
LLRPIEFATEGRRDRVKVEPIVVDLAKRITAPEVYDVVRVAINPVASSLGYEKAKAAPPTWAQKIRGPRTAFWARIEPRASDSYSGGRLVFEFEKLPGGRVFRRVIGRATLDQMLTPPEFESVLKYQNEVVASLSRPPAAHIDGYPESLRETYLSWFKPQGDFTPGFLWLRYLTLDHVRGWMSVITPLLPTVLERAERLDPNVLYPSSAIDLEATPLRPINPVNVKGWPGPQLG